MKYHTFFSMKSKGDSMEYQAFFSQNKTNRQAIHMKYQVFISLKTNILKLSTAVGIVALRVRCQLALYI